MIETKIAIVAAAGSALLAAAAPSTDDISEIAKLGLAGVSMYIVARMATHTIPTMLDKKDVILLEISKLSAEAAKEAAKVNAEANVKSASVHADAIANLGRVINDAGNRTNDMMADMITKAINTPPPGK